MTAAPPPVTPPEQDELEALIREARARRRRGLVAALGLAAAGAIAGTVLAGGAEAGSGAIPWLPTRPNLGPANPQLAPACKASQLRATLFFQGATGNLAGGITIVNRSSQPCALVGRPKLSFAGATSKWRETRWQKGLAAIPFDPLAPPPGSLRSLPRGEHVSVQLWWSNWCGRGSNDGGASGQPPTGIVLTAPGGGRIVLDRNKIGGGSRPLGAPPCYASPSTLAATGFSPFVPQGPPSSALPLRARIVSGRPISIKGKVVTQPSFVAHPGSWLFYTVVLTNRSRQPFRFGPACPAYTEGFVRPQAYVLNCHPVGSIGPGQSVRFAMRLRVPKRLSLLMPAFDWTLAPHTWNAPGALAVVELR